MWKEKVEYIVGGEYIVWGEDAGRGYGFYGYW